MAHAGRRYYEAIKALPKSQANTNTAANQAVPRIDVLYAIERDLKELKDNDPEQRQRIRIARVRPPLASLYAWALGRQSVTLPSEKRGEAFAYLLAQWPKLVRYVDHSRLALDTNVAENAIRPFALGRRNWLFADTIQGAEASAALFSLIETAKKERIEESCIEGVAFQDDPESYASSRKAVREVLTGAHTGRY